MDFEKVALEIGASWQPIGELYPQIARALERAELEGRAKGTIWGFEQADPVFVARELATLRTRMAELNNE
jgi:hypothetical protein